MKILVTSIFALVFYVIILSLVCGILYGFSVWVLLPAGFLTKTPTFLDLLIILSIFNTVISIPIKIVAQVIKEF